MPAGARSAGRAGLCAWETLLMADGARAAPDLRTVHIGHLLRSPDGPATAVFFTRRYRRRATTITGDGGNPPGNAQGSDKSTHPALVTGENPGKPFRRRNLAQV